MKTFTVVQQYASMSYVRSGQRMSQPLPLGNYQAASIESALKKAAREWKLPALLLHATPVVER